MKKQFKNNLEHEFNKLNKKNRQRKIKSIEVAKKIKKNANALYTSEKTVLRVNECANFMDYLVNETLDTRKLIAANFCKNRLCPICSKNLAVKNGIAISAMTKYLQAVFGYRFIFLTLTIPNVAIEQLPTSLDKLNYSFKKLFLKAAVKRIDQGYIKKVEVTYNKKTNTFHPHIHVFIAVNSSYFHNKDIYLSQQQWLDLWRDVTKNERISQLNIKAVKQEKLEKAILEISKYMAKDSDYTFSDDVFIAFYNGLYNRRMLTYNSAFKDAKMKFKNGELDEYIEQRNIDEFRYLITQVWEDDKYILEQIKELTRNELMALNKKYIDDIKQEMD